MDSPVASAWVPAPDHWSRDGASPRAVTVHMAEGGGTVSWLTHPDGNSSHYVVEYSGRVVQMVAESLAAGSMNPRATRTGDDAPYDYLGATVCYGRSALDAAGLAFDPNRYAIAIEVEGFAKDGPNAAQVTALRDLIADIRHRRGNLHLLGHRDQQDYKPCPGHKMPWAQIGGHGARVEVEPMRAITTTVEKLIDWPEATPYYAMDGTTKIGTANAETGRRSPFGCGTQRAIYVESSPRTLGLITPSAVYLAPDPGNPGAIEDARAEGYASAKTAALSAVEAI